MNCHQVKPGIRVCITTLHSTEGMILIEEALQSRQIGATGIVRSHVPGHGGDVWFVEHDIGDKIAAYCFNEMEQLG